MRISPSLIALASLVTAAYAAQEAGNTVGNRWSAELDATLNLAAQSLTADTPGINLHTAGVDLTGVYALNAHHAITLRLGYASGEASDSTLHGAEVYDIEGKLSTYSLMPGYRYTTPLSRRWSMRTGVNAGFVCHSVEERETLGESAWVHVSNYAWGPAFSAELGLSYARSQRLSYHVSYRFSGSTARPELFWNDGDTSFSSTLRTQLYHSISAGVSWKF